MKKRDSIHINRTYVYVLCSMYIYTHVYVHSTYRGLHTDGREGTWDSSPNYNHENFNSNTSPSGILPIQNKKGSDTKIIVMEWSGRVLLYDNPKYTYYVHISMCICKYKMENFMKYCNP